MTLASIMAALTAAAAAAPTVEALIADVENIIALVRGKPQPNPPSPGATSLAAMVAGETAAADTALETPIK